jgi:chromosome segregation ATPase
MSTDTTQNPPNGPSFEERVFARFDSLDARQERIETRLEKIETRLEKMEARQDEMDGRLQVLEQKAYDTKPIWERVIAEILELREDVHTLDRKFNIINPRLDYAASRAIPAGRSNGQD